MKDQKQFWNEAHTEGNLINSSNISTYFAEEIVKIMKPHSKILDLSCGLGYDAVTFAKAGHFVLATDFSEIAIKKNVVVSSVGNQSPEMLEMLKHCHIAIGTSLKVNKHFAFDGSVEIKVSQQVPCIISGQVATNIFVHND